MNQTNRDNINNVGVAVSHVTGSIVKISLWEISLAIHTRYMNQYGTQYNRQNKKTIKSEKTQFHLSRHSFLSQY